MGTIGREEKQEEISIHLAFDRKMPKWVCVFQLAIDEKYIENNVRKHFVHMRYGWERVSEWVCDTENERQSSVHLVCVPSENGWSEKSVCVHRKISYIISECNT